MRTRLRQQQWYTVWNGTTMQSVPRKNTTPQKNNRTKHHKIIPAHLHFEVRKVQVRCLSTAYIARDAFVCLGHGDCPVFASACESGEQINPLVLLLCITFIHSCSFASSKDEAAKVLRPPSPAPLYTTRLLYWGVVLCCRLVF